jgi:dihydroflavonol-4-reductase
VETVKCDVRNPDSVNTVLRGADVVYHLAAVIPLTMNHTSEVMDINVKGTQNVIRACLRNSVKRLIHFSSIHAVDQTPLNKPVNELNPLLDAENCPPYDISKAAAEIEVRKGIEKGLDAVILNPTAVMGPHDHGMSHIGLFLLALAQGKLPALVEGGFNWVDVRDVVQAALQAEKQARTGAKYILSGHYATVRELAQIAENITGKTAPRLCLPAWFVRAGAPVVEAFNQAAGNRNIFTSVSVRALVNCNKTISYEKAGRELGYLPRPLQETIFDTFRWFQEEGLLDKKVKLKTG